MLIAHETWFTDQRPPFDASFLTEPWTLAAIAAAVLVAVAWQLAAARLPQAELPMLAPNRAALQLDRTPEPSFPRGTIS